MVVAAASLSFPFNLFAYDSKGRATDVYKLQTINGSTYDYVRTQSSYGADGTPTYGNVTQVTEDSGTGLTNRTTETLTFHVSGKATQTRDALGREFDTVYDGDGNVLSVTRTDTTPDVPIATYSYGNIADTIENGQVIEVIDELSGVQQDIDYVQSGVAVGMPKKVTETNGSDSYLVEYAYSSLGDREYTTYTIGSDVTRWHYKDYARYGLGTNPARLFSRMNRMSWNGSSWQESGEEFAYTYDDMGRLWTTYFAQTPQSGQTNYESYPADSRALAVYDYDQAGRVNGVWYHWQYLSGGQYVQAPVWANTTDHSHKLGLKVASHFWEVVSGDWSLDRSEEYTYDAQTDWLTEVDYNDGLSNEVTTWTYDAAGNRASDSAISGSWTYDNLNRMTASPYGTYSNDILGNRTLLTTSGDDPEYHWDLLNRLQTYEYDDGGADEVRYAYRADGMRTYKIDTLGDDTETWYYHDGQMCVQDTEDDGTDVTVTKYGVGARGIDVITKKVNSGSETFGYPIYDTHGNMVATLARSGSNSFTTGNAKTYDVWGGTRSGSSSVDQGYVANLGHRTDSESSLTYMRARYYEPSTGRFISEDPALNGANWYSYASNDPVNRVDPDGRVDWLATGFMLAGFTCAVLAAGNYFRGNQLLAKGAWPTHLNAMPTINIYWNKASALSLIAVFFFACAAYTAQPSLLDSRVLQIIGLGIMGAQAMITTMTVAAKYGSGSAAGIAVISAFAYGLFILGMIIASEAD